MKRTQRLVTPSLPKTAGWRLIVALWIIIAVIVMVAVGCNSARNTSGDSNSGDSSATVLPLSPQPAPTALSDGQVAEGPEPASGGLDQKEFDDFIERSFRLILARDPELVVSNGLEISFDDDGVELTDLSAAYTEESYELHIALLDQLRSFEREELDPGRQLTYDIYDWYLDDLLRGRPYFSHRYQVNQFFTSEHNQVMHFFTALHPLSNLQEVENYIARLSKIETKFSQVADNLGLSAEAGIVPPRFVIQQASNQVRQIVQSEAMATPYYATFEAAIRDLDELSEDDMESLLARAEAVIAEYVKPAYRTLLGILEDIETRSTSDIGAWTLPDGEAYYAQLLRHYTTTDMTADEIHHLGFQELDRIQKEMRELFNELGYPDDGSLPDHYAMVARDGGIISGQDMVATYERIIDEVIPSLSKISNLQVESDVVVIGVPSGGYYVAPSFDGSRPGAFYATGGGALPWSAMPTLAYHEAVPGHHFQIDIAQQLDLPTFRNIVKFGAYVEGWALYAERLAWEMGLYEGDPYGDLGRLQAEAFRAARLVVDTGIHARGWTREQAIQFMVENTGLPRNMVANQVDRYIVWPGQATGYSIGMLKILDLRRMAEEQLGDQFDPVAFHDAILGQGSVPLNILETVVENHIAHELAG
jgi:uncharacterized protein (DUF885 family)